MNYDDIILECNTPCEECPTYLECQYQTSSGAEKKAWLEKLIERDKKAEEPVVEPVVEPVAQELEPVAELELAAVGPAAEPAAVAGPAVVYHLSVCQAPSQHLCRLALRPLWSLGFQPL